jgi:hypothetical protein
MDATLRITGWIAVVLLVVGQLLSWNFRTRPAGEAWDLLFSQVSRPNPEWWVWFLAPVISAFLAARDLIRQQKVARPVLLPIAVFFVTWVALFPLGHRRYTGFREPGFLATFVGMALLGAAAAPSIKTPKVAPSPRQEKAMKLNGKIIGGVAVLSAAIYWWLVARHSNPPPIIDIFYAFTFRLFRFADVLWTIAGATLLYRGIEEGRAA